MNSLRCASCGRMRLMTTSFSKPSDADHAREEDLGHAAGGEALQHFVFADRLPGNDLVGRRQGKCLDHISMIRFPTVKINRC